MVLCFSHSSHAFWLYKSVPVPVCSRAATAAAAGCADGSPLQPQPLRTGAKGLDLGAAHAPSIFQYCLNALQPEQNLGEALKRVTFTDCGSVAATPYFHRLALAAASSAKHRSSILPQTSVYKHIYCKR
eukprot:scaffold141725_cov24-Tisochrysis_lutea.AAC.1